MIVNWHQFERGTSETGLRESCWPRNLPSRSAADLMTLNSRPCWLFYFFFNLRQHLFCLLRFADQTVPPLLLTSRWSSAPSVFRFMDREACVWHRTGRTSETEWERDCTANRSLCHDAAGDRHEGGGERAKRTACCNKTNKQTKINRLSRVSLKQLFLYFWKMCEQGSDHWPPLLLL